MNNPNTRHWLWLPTLAILCAALTNCAPHKEAIETVAPTITNTPAPTKISILQDTPSAASATPDPTLARVVTLYSATDENGTIHSNAHIEPPPAILEINGARQNSVIGTFCWYGRCADSFATVTPLEPLTVHSSFRATLQLPINEAPATLQLAITQVFNANELDNAGAAYRIWDIPLLSASPTQLLLQRKQTIEFHLEPGLYAINIVGTWQPAWAGDPESGDIFYGFLLEVK